MKELLVVLSLIVAVVGFGVWINGTAVYDEYQLLSSVTIERLPLIERARYEEASEFAVFDGPTVRGEAYPYSR